MTLRAVDNKYVRADRLCANILWLLTLCAVCVAATLAALSAHWITASSEDASALQFTDINLGLYAACFDTATESDCSRYGSELKDIPHQLWRIAAVLFGLGLVFFWIAFIGAVIAMFTSWGAQATVTKIILTTASACLLGGTLVFLGGLGETNPTTSAGDKTAPCSNADFFDNGDCKVDLGLILAISASAIGVLVASLAFRIESALVREEKVYYV
eukprot:m.46619 g.46619  ORF g.46619 m.46619 type:complete len:215 (-) comp12558_c0_seq2:376-1020(-)